MRKTELESTVATRDHPATGTKSREYDGTQTVGRIGFWSAILSAILSALWFITYSLRDTIASVPDWHNPSAYAAAFAPLRQLYIYPSLLLALTFVALLACVYRASPEDRKIWALIGLAIGIVYATMASINYNIQAVAVRQSLLQGETEGLALFLPDNPNGVFNTLSNSYVYMALAMASVAPVFAGGRLQSAIRWLFLAQGLTALAQIGWSMFDLNEVVFLGVSLIWVVGAPVAFVLLAVLFKRTGYPSRHPSE